MSFSWSLLSIPGRTHVHVVIVIILTEFNGDFDANWHQQKSITDNIFRQSSLANPLTTPIVHPTSPDDTSLIAFLRSLIAFSTRHTLAGNGCESVLTANSGAV